MPDATIRLSRCRVPSAETRLAPISPWFPPRNLFGTRDGRRNIKAAPSRYIRLFGGRMDGFTSKGLRGIAKNKFLFSICRLTAAAAALVAATAGTQDAVANGDTRSLTFFHTHTKETATI